MPALNFFCFENQNKLIEYTFIEQFPVMAKSEKFFFHQTSLQFNQSIQLVIFLGNDQVFPIFSSKKINGKNLKKVENKKKENNSKKNLKRISKKMSCFYYYVNSLRKTRILFPSYHAWYRVYPIHHFFCKNFRFFFLKFAIHFVVLSINTLVNIFVSS